MPSEGSCWLQPPVRKFNSCSAGVCHMSDSEEKGNKALGPFPWRAHIPHRQCNARYSVVVTLSRGDRC